MTREEAIKVLEELWKYEHSGFSEKDIREALDMAIQALKEKVEKEIGGLNNGN